MKPPRSSQSIPPSILTSPPPQSTNHPPVGLPASSLLFIHSALEKIQAIKETKKNKPLKEAVGRALDLLKQTAPEKKKLFGKATSPVTPTAPKDPAVVANVVFFPLRLAAISPSPQLQIEALDCLGKLLSYGYISDGRMSGTITPLDELPPPTTPLSTTTSQETKKIPSAAIREETPVQQEQIPLIDRAIDVICDCFVGEGTDEKVQLQIIKALLSAVSSTIVPIHQATLLKAVRTTYNIFLLSRNPTNQAIAQSTLTQMVHIVFGRIKISPTFHTTTFSSSVNIAGHPSVTSLPQHPSQHPEQQHQQQQEQNETSPRKDPSSIITQTSPDTASVASSSAQLPHASENGPENSTDAGVEENSAVDDDASSSDHNASIESRLHSSATPPTEIDVGLDGIEKRDVVEAVEKAFDGRDDKEEESPVDDSIRGRDSDAQSQATEAEVQTEGDELDQSGNGGALLRRLSIQESRASLLSYTDELGSDVKPRIVHAQSPLAGTPGAESAQISLVNRSGGTSDVFTKDAFWVFRALCRLSMKPLSTEGASDLKSHSMRSKLLALHLILNILTSHLPVFTSPTIIFVTHESGGQQSLTASPLYPTQQTTISTTTTTFIEAVKQYLCLTISRNAVSVVPAIFETSLDIFARIIEGLRNLLRKEIEVFFNEIILSLLELKTASFSQKYALLNTLYKVCDDPRVVVEIYLNYDCDREALDNIYERIVNILSRVTTTRTTSIAVEPANTTPSLSDSHNGYGVPNAIFVPPSLTTANVHTTLSIPQQGTAITEWEIKHRSLECLVALLRSLVAWCGRVSGDGNMNGDASSSPGGGDAASISGERTPRMSEEGSENSSSTGVLVPGNSSPIPPPSSGPVVNPVHSRPKSTDDPSQFEELKHRKQLLQEGIRQFNFRAKKGIKLLIATGCIPARGSPTDIARFLLTTEGLSKANVGEYLGEGDPENIAIMHAFVNEMDFSQTKFVDALRMFLQRFRLPGEAQKIDRFMLKFAERFLLGNPGIFSNADTAYVLAYSTIMLNTDLHNPQVKKRMTQAEFIRNNRGIDNNASLPDKLLQDIYDEILVNEIKLKDEHDAAALAQAGKLDDVTLDSRTRREAHAQISEDIAQKTEALFKGMVKSSKNKNRRIGSSGPGGGGANGTGSGRQYTTASHFQHVRPMFEVAWMALLAGISGPLQESDDMEIVSHCLEGFGNAIRIISLFDMELERNAFVTTLAKFTFLNNLGEMKPKNVEAIKALLEIATVEGNYLKDSWKEVLTCVSQLERFQLISSGVGQNMVPDLSSSRQGRQQNLSPGGASRRSTKNPPSSRQGARRDSQYYPEDAAIEAGSQKFVVLVDRIFTMSSRLSGEAIVDFVRCLSDVSWDEIQSTSHLEHARTFSLQRLVEIAYYNMNRIRLEWSNIWAIMGDHFNMVGCHANVHVGMYALDSLRQLSMKFLEKEELANYQFQKEFLKPFEYIMANNQNVNIKDMVLRCLLQMIQARAHHLKSGWKTMFGVFTKAAQQPHEAIVVMSFDIVRTLYKDRFEDIIGNGTYPDFVECLVAFCKNIRFERTSLQAIEILRQTVTKMVALSQAQADDTVLAEGVRASTEVLAGTVSLADHPEFRFWYPTLNGYLDVIMTCMDLEVRTRALTYFFDALKEHGGTFTRPFWEDVAKKALFPIFDILRPDLREKGTERFPSKEDTTVWLSTTLIQALRSFVDLFSFYFDVLNSILLDGVLDLLTLSINQENETLSRMGTACLQQLIETNAQKLDEDMWHRMVQTFVTLFEVTMPHALFADSTRRGSILPGNEESPNDSDARKENEGGEDGERSEEKKRTETLRETKTSEENRSRKSSFAEAREEGRGGSVASEDNDGMSHSFTSPTSSSSTSSPTEEGTQERQQQRRRLEFQQIITKCVLQLLLVQNLTELLTVNADMYGLLKSSHLFGFLDCLERSYRFAQDFNRNTELRVALWKVGFMRQLPNLLKQETNSVSCHLTVLIRMYMDPSEDRRNSKVLVEAKLIRLSFDIIEQFNGLDQLDETKRREVASWRPVVVSILSAIGNFEEPDFTRHIPMFYNEIVTLLSVDSSFDIRLAVVQILRRTGIVYDIVPKSITDV